MISWEVAFPLCMEVFPFDMNVYLAFVLRVNYRNQQVSLHVKASACRLGMICSVRPWWLGHGDLQVVFCSVALELLR
jgi:hypothetical protein